MSNIESTLITSEEQYQIAQQVSSFADYIDFYRKHFPAATLTWPAHLKDSITLGHISTPSPEYWRFLALVSLQFAQNNFESLTGQLTRRNKTWRLPQGGRRHQLHMLWYGSNMNNQTFAYRNSWSEQLEENFPNAAKGVWGLNIPISKGVIVKPTLPINKVKTLAENRFKSGRPIYLPDYYFNQQLAEIIFTGDMAESMPSEQINQEILPRVQTILDRIIDIDTVFQPGTY